MMPIEDRTVKWNYADEIFNEIHIEKSTITNVIKLLEEDNTVPFIARYRQHLTGSLDVQKIRKIKEKVDELKKVEQKAISALKLASKNGKIDEKLEESILNATDIDIIDELVKPFKPGSRVTKVQQAKLFGLEFTALKILSGETVRLSELLENNIDGLPSVKEIRQLLTVLVADLISKDNENIEKLQLYCSESNEIAILSKKKKSITSENIDLMKFQEYFDFKFSVKSIFPFKFLALKRGESLNILKLSIDIPSHIKKRFINYCCYKYDSRKMLTYQFGQECYDVLNESFEVAYDKFLHPRMCTQIKNNLKRVAEQASVDSFTFNLKHLLLASPVKNKVIMGVDPGFSHGCKFAVINACGEVLDSGIAYLHRPSHYPHTMDGLKGMDIIQTSLITHSCEVIAIGNGVGCRETEKLFSYHIKIGTFLPLNVLFCIVSEAGASIYSASELASTELSFMDVTLRGAVSIARRLQDPLVELIKIDPKNLGIGMYQHDIPESRLKSSLDGVIEDCVSLVGVNVNLCSSILLQHIAGIGQTLATKILNKRTELGGQFTNRSQFLKVNGVGPKKFRQFAGFLRIYAQPSQIQGAFNKNLKRKIVDINESVKVKRAKKNKINENVDVYDVNPLDRTSVHPESYHVAQHLIDEAQLENFNIGEDAFIAKFRLFVKDKDLQNLAVMLNSNIETIKQIVESLLQPIDSDIRNDSAKPLFRQEVLSINKLKVHQVVHGKVTNVTDFGAFVDIGVEKDALIHTSAMSSYQLLLGDCVEAEVIRLEVNRLRIGLKLIKIK